VEQLLDTKDAVRRLQLLRVRDALRANGLVQAVATTDQPIAADASLREAVSAFLEGAERLRVVDDEATLGTLVFSDIRAALESER
jgi:hypothetical protein